MSINRIVIAVTAVLSLAVGLLPAIANLDWTSTAGILASLGTVAGLVLKWLDGWQQHEAQQAWDHTALVVAPEDTKSDTLPS